MLGLGGPNLLASGDAERRGARNVSASRYASAEVEQRKLNEMIGAELG